MVIGFLSKHALNTKKNKLFLSIKVMARRKKRLGSLKKKKSVGTFIVHDVMEEKILWNNSMSKGSSVSPTLSYLDFVSACYNSIVNYNNYIS